MRIIEGNLLLATENIIGHQVNCMGVMGSGIAMQIKTRYPSVFQCYKQECERGPSVVLGTCQLISMGNNKYIANLFGQYFYGREKTHTDYVALELALRMLYSASKKMKLSVALPYNLGCGLGDGDWERVSKTITDIFHDDVTIYKLDGLG